MTDFTINHDGPGPSQALASPSAISWPAVFAGVFAAVAISLILFSLGAGFGLAAASPWGAATRGAGAIGIGAAIWLVVVQWLASAMGGYITGRLRTRWIGTHTHEVFFRDTANGFIAWAVATVLVAAVAAVSTIGAANKLSDMAGGPAAQAAFAADADAIYRTNGDLAATAGAREEAQRILAGSVAAGGMSAEDRAYLAASASARAGITPSVALQRVDVAAVRERDAAEKARKAASALALLTALSLLVGAFIACVAGALGGLERDKHP